MSDYQVIARKFRPQSFKDVIGQEAIVTTLKNAIKFNRLAQAYLFCGSRGTGKTTLARLLAKALNCQHPSPDLEPCNQCSSCREITAGTSLEVLEIDGASHRGIEDIRQINDTVGYATTSGCYKVYIIDEVHMLTKEAFNALLKTLEEPPLKVKFFFATTEPHKVPSTILSRCQRFNLNRIPLSQIVSKLRFISQQLNVKVEEEALVLLAQRAEGGLRDAESLFDQILAFEDGFITAASVTTALGLMPREVYFELDQAGKQGMFAKAFEIADRLFSEGKELLYFVEGLIDHLRQILLIKITGPHSSYSFLTENEKDQYVKTAQLYSQEQCVDLIEYLLQAQNQFRITSFSKVSLEAILLHVMRSHFRISIEQLVFRLSELEQAINEKNTHPTPSSPEFPRLPFTHSAPPSPSAPEKTSTPMAAQINPPIAPPHLNTISTSHLEKKYPNEKAPASTLIPSTTTTITKKESIVTSPRETLSANSSLSEDPTPSPSDLGKRSSSNKKTPPVLTPSPPLLPPSLSSPQASSLEKIPSPPIRKNLKRPIYEYDTLLHFAAVELEGRLQKTNTYS